MDFDALLDEGDGKRGGMRSLAFAGLDGFVGNEPGVSATAKIFSSRVTPACDVGFVHIGHASGAAIERDIAGFREVKQILVAVVDVALGIDGFEMPGRNRLAVHGSDSDRFHPVKRVLQNEQGLRSIGESEDELVGKQGIRGCGTYVEEKRCVVFHHAFHFGCPRFAPGEKFLAWGGVFEGRVVDPEIVWGRCHHEIEEFFFEGGEGYEAIAV